MGELKRPSGFAQYKHQAHTSCKSEIFNHCNILKLNCFGYIVFLWTTYEDHL